ncbi:LysR family transcriptional regulator [Rhodanobacter sp. L36]|uniref:LysR family transcriptional regulator n=1 Tax=Rhodanobacter sp. L36 TaxID=1747221 RepID=UPI001C201904|nr:LysR family transcriptional regulator [Rhodanobacter sp. L36]
MFDDMKVFAQVIESGSFSGAARRLDIAKSAVTRHIAALESRLQGSVINRSTRRLSLTEMGQAYYDRARRILDDVAEADEVARSLQVELIGRLRIAAPMSFAHAHLSPAVAAFLTEHPRVEIELDLDDEHVDLINGGFDLAVRIGALKDSSMIARLLAPCRRVVCASPSYLAIHGEPTTLDDLEAFDHRCLVYSNRPVADQWRFKVGDTWQVARVTRQRLTCNNGQALCDAAIEGLGLAVLPTFMASEPIVRGQLKMLLRDYPLAEPSIYAVWPPGRQLSTKARAMVEALSQRFGPTPYWDKNLSTEHELRRS